jgi:hypothetical protein
MSKDVLITDKNLMRGYQVTRIPRLDTLPHNALPGWTLTLLEEFDSEYEPADFMNFYDADDYPIAIAGGKLWLANGDDESSYYDVCFDGTPYKQLIKSQSFKENVLLDGKIETQDDPVLLLVF